MTGVAGSGNGWVTCAQGHRHWGLHGAAGLLVRHGDRILLQQRAGWSHEGGTWAIPGGARDLGESPADGALREAQEEVGIDQATVELGASYVDDHGGWSYVTVAARSLLSPEELRLTEHAETAALAWVERDRVTDFVLHAGFAASWPHVRDLR